MGLWEAVGSGAGRWLDNRLGYGDQGTCAGHCMANTPADVLKGAKKDPKKPTLKDGTDQYVKDNTNGMPDAQKDFNSLNPQNVTTDENGTSVGNLSDGTQVVVRPKSVPSLEINPPTGTPVAIRYK